MNQEQLLEAAEKALEAGDPVRALETLGQVAGDPELEELRGIAHMQLAQWPDARAAFRESARLDGSSPGPWVGLAYCAFETLDLDEAEATAAEALGREPEAAGAYEILGLIHERRGDFERADAAFARATELDPQDYPAATRMSTDDFEAFVAQTIDALPNRFRDHIARVAVIIEPVPADEDLNDDLSPTILGLFAGAMITEESHLDPTPSLPPRVVLYQRNLERHGESPEQLAEDIQVTVLHELAHLFGHEDDAMEDMGLA